MSTSLQRSTVPLEGSTKNSVLLLRTAPKSQAHFASTAKGSVSAPSGTFGARGERCRCWRGVNPPCPPAHDLLREHISTARQRGFKLTATCTPESTNDPDTSENSFAPKQGLRSIPSSQRFQWKLGVMGACGFGLWQMG